MLKLTVKSLVMMMHKNAKHFTSILLIKSAISLRLQQSCMQIDIVPDGNVIFLILKVERDDFEYLGCFLNLIFNKECITSA